jgi:hypothetical protein
LTKLCDKLEKLKSGNLEEEENEYENFYNRISFYFSNIVTEMKLMLVEKVKEFEIKEEEMTKIKKVRIM